MSSTTDPESNIDPQRITAPAEPVEQYLARFLDEVELPTNLVEAIRYSLLGSGKRLRPILILRSCEAVGGTWDDALPAAAAIEMIHCFSLIHDDLPAMDDDDLRRGRPTLHKHASEGMAILAGDALMGLAFQLLLERIEPPDRAGRIASELVRGTNAMIAGQVYDTLGGFAEGLSQADKLHTIHRHKTGALLRAACRMGALCAGADDDQLDALTRYGEAIGVMFQAVDDLLDVTQTTEHLGKTAGKDAEQEKLTYPGIYGLDQTRDQIKRMHEQAVESLQDLGAGAAHLREICNYLAVRTK